MKRFPQTLTSINVAKRMTFSKFLETDSSFKSQRTIIIQLNTLHNFLVKNGILTKPKIRTASTDIPPLNQAYQLHLQRLALMDRNIKTYNIVYHPSLHNQMTKILFLALFTNNEVVIQKILDSGYPHAIIRKCIPLYHYFCATGNKKQMDRVSYKPSCFFGLSASIILAFKGRMVLKHTDLSFMTLKQYLLFNEYRGINTIDRKVNKFLSGYCGYSSESSVNSSNTENSSHEHEDIFIHSQTHLEKIRCDIDHKVLFAIDFLCIRNDFKAVEELLKNAPDAATASQFCFLLQCHTGITLKLLQYRANPDQTFRGYTPLHIAARLGSVDVAAIFLALNADPEAKDFFNRTPAYYAKLYKHEQLAEFITESTKRRFLPRISTEYKSINFSIFDYERYKERLNDTKTKFQNAMKKQYYKSRFTIVSLLSLTSAMKTVKSQLKVLEEWKSERVYYTTSSSYEKFKSIVMKK